MKKYLVFFLLPLLASCSIVGVHFKVHNPKRAGKYPEPDAEQKLLTASSHLRDCYDVKYYKIDVKIDPVSRAISGVVRMEAIATAAFDTLQFDLAENMILSDALVPGSNEQPSWTRRGGAVFVRFGETQYAGKRIVLEMYYSGKPAVAKRPPWRGGFVWKKDAYDKTWSGVACQSEGASLWWPCKDWIADEADSTSINISIPAPTDLTAVSNGRLRGTDEKDGWKTFRWFVSNPINNYNVTFYIGNFQLIEDKYESKVTGKTLDLNHYVLAQNTEKAKLHFQQLKKQLAFYEDAFGPYPWYRDSYKLVESPYAGMEHQSAIAYGNGYSDDRIWGFDYIVLHETAHEWWGNNVTAKDLGDGWIHEGFATYAEALYVERTQGRNAYLKYLLRYRIMIINRRAVSHPYNLRYFDYRDGDMYVKGAWALHSLRTAINNDTVFFDILKTFATQGSPKHVSTSDFMQVVNSKTGKNWQWFFDQYLYNRLSPELEYCVSGDKVYWRWNPKTTKADFALEPSFTNVAWLDTRKDAHTIVCGKITGEFQPYPGFDFLMKNVKNKKLKKLYAREHTGK